MRVWMQTACDAHTDRGFVSFSFFKHSSNQPNHYGNQRLHVQAAGHNLKAMLLFSPCGRPRNCLMSLKSQKSFNRAAVVLCVINTCYCYAAAAEWARNAPSPGHLLPPSPSTSCFNQFGPIWKRRRPPLFNWKLLSQLGVHTSLGFISFPFQRHPAGRAVDLMEPRRPLSSQSWSAGCASVTPDVGPWSWENNSALFFVFFVFFFNIFFH